MSKTLTRIVMTLCLFLPLASATARADGFFEMVRKTILKWFITPPPPADTAATAQLPALSDDNIPFRFFDDRYTPGGFPYVYPEESKVTITEETAKNGEASLLFNLVADDYSGGAVCLYNMTYDLRPYLKKAALQFWIKGALGNETTMVAFVDEDKSDRRKAVVRLPVHWFGPITTEWSLISVPLEAFDRFNDSGVFWDDIEKKEIPSPFDWGKVAEVRFEVKKNENRSFRVWVDDIFIVRTAR